MEGINFIANEKFMRWLSIRRASVATLDYDGATNHIAFSLVSDRTCGRIKVLKLANVCGDEAKSFLYKAVHVQKLGVVKLRKTSKHRIIVPEECLEARDDCCPLLTEILLEDMAMVPSEIVKCLLGKKVATLLFARIGTFSKEFATVVAAKFCNLKSLRISEAKELSDSRLTRLLKGCTDLTSLYLDCCPSLGTATVLSIGQYCANLTSLRLSSISSFEDGFEDAFVQLTKSCTQVQSLILDFVLIFDASLIAIIQNMKNLITLRCAYCSELLGNGTIVPDQYAESKIESITFSNCKNLVNVLNICQVCPRLRELDLTGSQWIGYGALTHILMHGRNLERLALNSQRSYGRDLDAVTENNLPKLTTLDISSCAVTDEGLGYICRICPNITKLRIDDCWELTNEGLLSLGFHLRDMEVLSMNKELNFTESGLVSAVAHAQHLRVLVFSLEVNMSHTALIALAQMPLKRLHTVAISGFQFNGLYFEALMVLLDSCTSLQRVYLDSTYSFMMQSSAPPCSEDDKRAFLAMMRRIYKDIDIVANQRVDKLNVFEL